ncbi:MAG: IS21 family transposase [Candidatus Paceibacterota bacterium]
MGAMSNVLKVNKQETIRSLYGKGWSLRRIAEELGINRRTVARHAAKCTREVTSGSEGGSKCTGEVTPGSRESVIVRKATGGGQARSECAGHGGVIEGKVGLGLSAQRIYQDLVSEQGFGASYQSVKRYVAKLKAREPKRVWRIECQPGEEVQVDFGLGAMIEDEECRRRRSWVFRMVLSYSRKGYSEAVMRQDTETFLRCLENAFRYFGGVAAVLNLDNLKAAVLKADWYDPEINPKLADFCRHYGVCVVPCRPATPQHKGKVESGVKYVRNNGLKGHRFESVGAENAHLSHWETHVADKRIHGTTCKQVAALFEEERAHLQPLPASLFPSYQEALRTVGRDSFVEVARSFYEVPPEYIGNRVWARWDGRVVRIFNERREQVQMHTRLEPGKFSRVLGCSGMSHPVLVSCGLWVERVGMLGRSCQQWAQGSVDRRGPEALRSIMGLWSLRKTHTSSAVNQACEQAVAGGLKRLKDIKRLLGVPGQRQEELAFQESHPLIRDLGVYGEFINNYEPSNP